MEERDMQSGEPAAEPTDLERFLAQMLNASAEVADDYAAQVSAGLRRGDPAEEAPRERPMTPQETQLATERAAVEAVWDDVRACSAEGRLVTPDRWEEAGMVPGHLDPDQFSVLVFDTLEACLEGRPFDGSGLPVALEGPASGERADGAEEGSADGGASEAKRGDEGGEGASEGSPVDGEPDGAAPDEPGGCGDARGADTGEEPSDDGAGEASAEPLLEPRALEEARAPLACSDMVVLEGRKDTYLYARGVMSDNFAHWAFLEAEDDDLLTLVDNVRQESRLYPRPMLAAAFGNPPYRWTKGRTEAAFEAVQACGAYPDIAQVVAGNGDVYYYSADFLSAAQARALAQWYSVEKPMNV